MVKDILTDESGDLQVRNGDLVVAESDELHIQHLVVAWKGYYKQAPLAGAGVADQVKGPIDLVARRKLEKNVLLQLEADRALEATVEYDNAGILSVSALYEEPGDQVATDPGTIAIGQTPNTVRTVLVKPNQSLLDLALRYYGGVEGIVWLLEDNPDVYIEHRLDPGMEIVIRDSSVNAGISAYYERTGQEPATAIPIEPDFNNDFNNDFQ